jgi:hypothetical protein
VDYNIGTDPEFSILDEVRRGVIGYVKQHLDEADERTAALRRLSIETKKLAA